MGLKYKIEYDLYKIEQKIKTYTKPKIWIFEVLI